MYLTILTNQSPDQRSKIQATSVYKFKGLEKKVVILAEIDNHTNYNHDMVMYVGCSRARVHLIILSDEKTPNQIGDRINPYT
ncbi:MAG: ATP-binding domain-containing protein [Pelolinea sp.]|nr:ATP-binding domain-containing protein [Pelolinea sp.]